MTPEAAAWVADIVLTRAMLKAYSRQDLCSCYGGVCHHCLSGHRERCVVVAWGGAPPVQCEGWITDRKGRVIPGCPDVWRAGRPCRWVCACTDCPPRPERPPVDAPSVAIQLDIFSALMAGAR